MSSTIILIFLLLVAITILASLADIFRLPYPILLVLGGLTLSFTPGLGTFNLDPELILFLFLPPLIYSSAWQISWREFMANLSPILFLAIGLVLATVFGVAVAAHFFVGLSWPVAFVLGAIVSPTDAIAASATAKNLNLAPRIVTILEGESMINDASGLVVYRFAVAAVVTGTFSLGEASLQFLLYGAGGLLIGLVVAWPLAHIHRRFDDALIEITITLLTPFAAYLLAEEVLHVSGVLATLSAGLYLSRQSVHFFSSNTRLQSSAVWNVLVFLLNGFVFLLVGLQEHTIFDTITRENVGSLLWSALVICLAVILVRVVWVFSGTYLLYWLLPRLRAQEGGYPDWRNTFLIAWAGMRGGVSLAIALALPTTIQNGGPFPQRDLIIFLTSIVILFTLVFQGMSLLPIIHFLNPPADEGYAKETRRARIAATRAALRRLDQLADKNIYDEDFIARLRTYYEEKLRNIMNPGPQQEEHQQHHQEVVQELLQAQRMAIIQLRDQKQIDDEVLRAIERELDLEEQRLQV